MSTPVDDAADRALAGPRARALERIERVVAATAAALTEAGAAITTEDVVRRAGVSRRSITSLFGSFDDLLVVAFDATTEGRLDRQRQAFEAHADDPVAQLREMIRVRWQWCEGEPMPLARARATLYPSLQPSGSSAHERERGLQARSTAAALAGLRRLGRLAPVGLDDVELGATIDAYLRVRLADRVLAVPPDVAVLPPDPDGFEDTCRVLLALLVRPGQDGDPD